MFEEADFETRAFTATGDVAASSALDVGLPLGRRPMELPSTAANRCVGIWAVRYDVTAHRKGALDCESYFFRYTSWN